MTLIDRFLTGEYIVRRTSKGTFVDGIYQRGPVEEIKVEGSIQPTSARELKLPTEGARLRQYWKFYSDQPILVVDPKTLADSDRVVINGDEYRAMSLTPWQDTDLDYFMTVLWREPQQSSDGKGSG